MSFSGYRDLRVGLLLLTALLLLAMPAAAETFRYDDSWHAHGLNVQRQGTDGLSLSLSLENWELGSEQINGRGQAVVLVPGVILPNEAGAPNLPGFSRFVALPQSATATVKIVRSRTEVITDVDLAPAPAIPLETEDGPLTFTRNGDIYGTNADYPEHPVRLGEVTEIRGVDAVMLGVTPFQYNPITRELTVHRDLELEVSFHGGSSQVGDARLRSRWFDPILDDIFANNQLIPAAPEVPVTGLRTPDFEYVIITAPAYMVQATELARFRNEQGIRTVVYTPDEIGGNTTTAIEDFIDDAYNNWDVPPVAVLLLGDYGEGSTGIPSPMYDSYCVSDNIYADVTGNHMPDVILARMTAANATHAETFVGKVIDYETTPPTTPGYYQNPIVAGGWQTERWFILCDEVLYGFMANELGKTPVREYAIYDGTPSTSWSSATNTQTVVDYFGPGGLGYLPATPAHLTDWGGNATRLNADLEAGAFILQHRDHGGEDGWGEPDYTQTHLANLNNEDLSFVFSINCLTGKFNYSSECFAETFHRMADGALGIIAASEVSYSFVNDTYVWGMFDYMWPDFDPGHGTAGEHKMLPAFANASGKYFLEASSWPYNTNNKEVTYYLFHHHGDAFSTVYSEMPQSLVVSHEDALLSGVDFFNVTADAGALIGLSVGGEYLGSAVSAGGVTTIPIPAQLPGQDLVVTVTKQNHYRYSQPVPIIPPEGPWVIHSGHALNDLEGNGNGQLDFGESSLLSLELHNVGLEASTRVAATIACSDPYLVIDDANANYPDIPADGFATATDAYHLALAVDAPDGHVIPVLVTVVDADSTYESSFELVAHAPVLEVPTYTITGDEDADGILDPGETGDLVVTLANVGTAEVLNLAMTIVSDNPNVTVNAGSANLAQLGAESTADITFNVTASSEAGIGEPVSFAFDVVATNFAYATSLDMAVGLQIEDFETGTLLAFPWEFDGNADWSIVTEDPYEGTYCAKSGNITHNQHSSLVLEANVLTAGTITFQYKVSSESGYDYLQFAIDGTVLGEWAGSVGWAEAQFPVTAGVHTFSWIYDKDGSVDGGSDCGWIDYIVFPAVSEPPRPSCQITPESLDVTLVQPASDTRLLNVVNSGEGELVYSVEVALQRQRQTEVPTETFKKDEVDWRQGEGPGRGAGGPDPFGYTWIDSDEPGGPAYQWVEINQIGTQLNPGDDSNLGPFDLGFEFPFYGQPFNSVRVCSNGWVSFTSTSTAYSNQGIPNTGEPNNLLAALWDDLNPNDGGDLYYYADAANQRFIVEWDGIPHYSSGNPETFQIIISADGSILYNYRILADGGDCTVGIENAAGDTGLQVNFNTSFLHSEMAILFASEPLPEPWMELTSYTGTVAPGSQGELEVVFNSVDSELGDYQGLLTVHTNDLENPSIQIPVDLHVVDDPLAVDDLPTAFNLGSATPNPFNPATTINFAVPRSGHVQLRVFDVAGRLVRSLVDGQREAGYHSVMWNGKDGAGRGVASGVYYYRIEADGYEATRKMMLVK